jgi:hypothetical protein
MTIVTLAAQKVLGTTVEAQARLARLGGLQNSDPLVTTNITELQKYYDNGYTLNCVQAQVTIDGQLVNVVLPVGDELSGIFHVLTNCLLGLQQNTNTYIQSVEYPAEAIVRKAGTKLLYRSVITNNLGADLNAASYSSVTTYALGDFSKDTSGNIYISLVDTNINNALTDNTKWKLVWEFIIDFSEWKNISTYLTTFNQALKLVKTDSSNKIDNTLLNTATESAPGIAQIATQAKVSTGTDDLDFITSLKLQARLNSLFTNTKAVTGYTYLANGIILQWGQLAGGSPVPVTLPIAFPNAIFHANCCHFPGDSPFSYGVETPSLSQLILRHSAGATIIHMSWFAIGY